MISTFENLQLDKQTVYSCWLLTFLFRNLCLGLEDLQLVFMISSHELFIKLLKDDERKLLVDQMRKRSLRINLSTKPVTSFYDIPGNFPCSCWLICMQLPVFIPEVTMHRPVLKTSSERMVFRVECFSPSVSECPAFSRRLFFACALYLSWACASWQAKEGYGSWFKLDLAGSCSRYGYFFCLWIYAISNASVTDELDQEYHLDEVFNLAACNPDIFQQAHFPDAAGWLCSTTAQS